MEIHKTSTKYKYEIKEKVSLNDLKPIKREQLALVLFINEMTGRYGKELLAFYIDLVLPIELKVKDSGYKALISYRSIKKSAINKLINQNLKLKSM